MVGPLAETCGERERERERRRPRTARATPRCMVQQTDVAGLNPLLAIPPFFDRLRAPHFFVVPNRLRSLTFDVARSEEHAIPTGNHGAHSAAGALSRLLRSLCEHFAAPAPSLLPHFILQDRNTPGRILSAERSGPPRGRRKRRLLFAFTRPCIWSRCGWVRSCTSQARPCRQLFHLTARALSAENGGAGCESDSLPPQQDGEPVSAHETVGPYQRAHDWDHDTAFNAMASGEGLYWHQQRCKRYGKIKARKQP